MPMDILTDAKVNSGEIILSDRSNRHNHQERRQNRHRQQIGESGDENVKELLRMAS